jgi:hypothetical protein
VCSLPFNLRDAIAILAIKTSHIVIDAQRAIAVRLHGRRRRQDETKNSDVHFRFALVAD